jgi:hypothetical protein
MCESPTKAMTLIVGMVSTTTKEQAEGFKARLAERGIDAIIITGVTSLAVVNP